MQTFLPYPDFQDSLACLDNKRLGKQRLEAYQIIQTIIQKQRRDFLHCGTIAWGNHPATLQWEHHLNALKLYYNISLHVWANRGFQNKTLQPFKMVDLLPVTAPKWLGFPAFHISHRCRLLQKDYAYYSKKFPATLEKNPTWQTTEYVWPSKEVARIQHWHNTKKAKK